MRKDLYGSEKITLEESKEERNIEYMLLVRETPFAGSDIRYISYGIEINMSDKNNELIETAREEDLFFSKEKAVEFIDDLKKGRVTPCTLGDIVADTLRGAVLDLQ